MKLSCDVIRDLLPLYRDEVCSTASQELVEEHLAACALCRQELLQIEEELDPPHIPPEPADALHAVAAAWKKAKKRSFRKGILAAAAALTAVLVLWNLAFSVERMEGGSMAGSIENGTLCLFSRVVGTPDREDIVQAAVTLNGYSVMDIARIAAVPGDTVSIEDGTLFINGSASTRFVAGQVESLDWEGERQLGMDEYFVLGDDPVHATDSRSQDYGLLHTADIKGKYILALPPSPFGEKVQAGKVG